MNAALAAPRLGLAIGAVGIVAVCVLAAALTLRLPGLIAPALVVLGGEYAMLFLVRDRTVDVRAPLYGAGFLIVAELAFAAVELRAGVPDPLLFARRAAALVVVALGGIVLGAVVLAAATVPLDGGIALEAAGIAAAVGVLVFLGRLAVRSS